MEATRQVLAENIEFDPEIAFFRLDRGFSTRISFGDVRRFLRENGIGVDLEEASFFVLPHNDKGDGKLTYKEFLQCVLPKNCGYRNVVTTRMQKKPGMTIPHSKKFVAHNAKLPYEVEYSIRRIIEGEIEL